MTVQFIFGQSLTQFKISETNSITLSEAPGLRSNFINCIAPQGEQTTWIGTGQGLSVMHDSTEIFTLDTLYTQDDEPRFMFGTALSISVEDNKMAFTSATSENGFSKGTGIFYTEDGLADRIIWKKFDQPIDGVGDSLVIFGLGYFNALPTTTEFNNVSYDSDLNGNYLWIASWAGGLRRLDLNKLGIWERIPLPLDSLEALNTCEEDQYEIIDNKSVLRDFYLNPRDPEGGGHHNHKAFSVLAYEDTVWVGTANGINRGIMGENGCINWRHYSHPFDNLSGNWVLSIAKQEYGGERIIWAATVNAVLPTEQRAVSYTRDDGETWEIVQDLKGERCHDISISGSTILVASDNGLWKSENGTNWGLIPPAVEATPVSSNEILNNTVNAVAADDREYFKKPIIWIGTPDGLARSYNTIGDNWQIHRSINNIEEVYAYPNPFSPFSHNQLNNDGWVRFNVGDFSVQLVNLRIYNFALEEVYTEKFDWVTNPGAVKWNGRGNNGELVSNGVYFVNLQFSENGNSKLRDHLIKLVVVK